MGLIKEDTRSLDNGLYIYIHIYMYVYYHCAFKRDLDGLSG